MSEWIGQYFHLLCAIIGVLCAYEANLILRAKGAWILDKHLLWTTSIEFIWVIICCLGIFSWGLTGWKLFTGLIFLVNYLFAGIYTGYLFRGANLSDPSFFENFQIPRWYLEYYFSFGLIYSITNFILFL